jgi:putative protease
MKKPELLAPVGSIESLYAAIEAGADAVYLSGKKYGARVYANNFNDEELIEAIKYAHIYGVKVYVTVNTIIYEYEVEDFINYIDMLHKNNVDAIIIQDIGMFDLIRKTYPNLEIHISTQMHVHNIEGVKFFEKLNAQRVVLARETDINTIKEIKKNTNIEIEVFTHGALCISYSGQCLMSSLIGGRSGNRGACAGCCRLPYDIINNNKIINEDKYPLSTKDLMTLDHIQELIESGIDSFKIEGRMKRPEYVYQVVSLYRKAIDSYMNTGKSNITQNDIKEMKKLFNREFTSGYLFNEKYIINGKRPNHQGIEIGEVINYKNGHVYIKLKEKINIHDGIRIIGKSDKGLMLNKMFINKTSVKEANKGDIINFKYEYVKPKSIVVKTTDYKQIEEINKNIENKTRKVSIQGKITLKEKAILELTDRKNTIKIEENIIEPAKNNPIKKETIQKQINRLKETPFKLEKLEIIMDDNIFINIKNLNELRRKAVEQLIQKRLYKIEYIKKDYKIEVPNFEKTQQQSYLISTLEQYKNIKTYDYLYIDNEELYEKLKGKDIYLKLPRVINKYKNITERILVGEIGSINKYKNIDTDFSLNIVNSYGVAFLHSLGVNKITLSHELTLEQTKQLIDNYKKRYKKHPNLEVITECYEEAMVSKHNILEYYKIKEGKLKDKFNNLYDIKIKDNLMYIYNYKKRNLNKQEYYNIGINVTRINL